MKDLVLFGAGGSGREIAYLVETINKAKPEYNLLGFVDDNESTWGKNLNGYSVLGGFDWLKENKDHVYCTVTIGTMKSRVAVCDKLDREGIMFETLIHPSASIGSCVEFGRGCIVNEKCELTCNIKIGDFVFLNSDTCLGHDDIVGRYTIFNPHSIIAGGCVIGERVMIGGMSFVVQLARIGDDVVVAPGSVVYGRVKSGLHIMGNPAKKIDI